MFDAVSQYTQPERLSFGHCLLWCMPIGQHARELKHFGQPAAIFFLLIFYCEPDHWFLSPSDRHPYHQGGLNLLLLGPQDDLAVRHVGHNHATRLELTR